MKPIKLTMAESIENSKFSTRLQTVLKRMASFKNNQGLNLDDALERYRQDPVTFEAEFLRIQGAGKISFEEFQQYAEGLDGDGDYTGRTYAMNFDEAAEMQDAVGAACNSIDASTSTYQSLRKLQHLLDCSTIHFEQLEDQRPMFNRGHS